MDAGLKKTHQVCFVGPSSKQDFNWKQDLFFHVLSCLVKCQSTANDVQNFFLLFAHEDVLKARHPQSHEYCMRAPSNQSRHTAADVRDH